MNDLYEQNRERMQNAQNDEAIKDIRQAQQNLRGIIATLQALGDLEKCKKLMDVEQFVDAYLKIAEAYAASCRIFSGDADKKNDCTLRYIQAYMEQARAESAKRREDLITELRKRVEREHHEAEKNLRLLNEARGVIWHSVEEELPSENGTYLVVGKSGTVCTAHFYTEHTSYESGIKYHAKFSNRYVRFWAKLPEPPVPNQDYQHTDNK